MSKAMLKLVCWLYFQVLAVMYFLPWFQVTFWEGAQTMRKSTKHAHLHDIHEVWLSRYGSTTHGPPLVCFYVHCVLEMLGRSWKNPRKSINFFNAVCTLLFCFGIQLTIQNQKTSCSPRTRMLTRMLMGQMSKHMEMQWRRTLFWNSLFEQSCTFLPCYHTSAP